MIDFPDDVGIAWFRPETYDVCRSLFEDGDGLPSSYAGWLAKAERKERDVIRMGKTVHRIDIDPATFPQWCKNNGYRVNARARVEYASWKVAEKLYEEGRGPR